MPGAGLTSACSVCGVRINAETRTIRESKPSELAILLFGLGLFVWAVGNSSLGRWEPHQILILASCVLLTWLLVSGKRREAVLWAEGVVFLEKGAPPRKISWNGVARIEVNPARNRIEFITADGTCVNSIPAEFFGTSRRADQFTRETSMYLGKHSNDSSEP